MADTRPPADEPAAAPSAQSAEDRKAESALASLDARHDASAAAAASKNFDRRAVDEAMKRLGGAGAAAVSASGPASASASSKAASAAAAAKAGPVKNVKVDAGDVALVADQLDLARPKAMELLRAHDGDAVEAMRAYVRA